MLFVGHQARLFSIRRPLLSCNRRLVIANSSKHGQAWGNVNRLGSTGGNGTPGFKTDADENIDYQSKEPAVELQQRRSLRPWLSKWEEVWGKAQYSYYNWRQDTYSDLQLFMVFNIVLLLLGGYVEGSVIRQLDGTVPRSSDGGQVASWWGDIYSVMVWMLGQDLPRVDGSGLASQVFAVMTVVLGLVSFALVLALVEQVVLEVLESNVKQGSQVYEEGHVVVLAWCESAYDLSQLTRVLGQVCHANAGKEGSAVVVLAQDREKLEMEAIFRRAIPDSSRLGTKFVFRQGSPLDPDALRTVAATKARAVIITADSARSAPDSDAQCLRAAVLLDELIEADLGADGITPSSGGGPSIVFQLQNQDSLTTVQYACSERLIAVPVGSIQAKRIARIVRNPVVAVVSNMLTDFRSSAHMSMHEYPSLVGRPFRDMHLLFPSAIVFGVFSSATNKCRMNPSPDRLLGRGEKLCMLRPGPADDAPAARPLPQPIAVDIGDWDPAMYMLNSQDEEPLGVDISACSLGSRAPRPLSDYLGTSSSSQPVAEEEPPGEDFELPRLHVVHKRGVFVLPLQYSSSLVPTGDLLICGWGRSYFMYALLQELNSGTQALPPGSSLTLFNEHDLPEDFGAAYGNLRIRHIQADPRSMHDLRTHMDIGAYKSVVVVADTWWADRVAAARDSHTYRTISQVEMLRVDAAVLLVQLNIRALLAERGLPELSIVVQRMTMVGNTRFEDPSRLPLGLPVNPASFVGKVLTQVAFDPHFLRPYAALGVLSDIMLQDSSAFAAPGEALSFLQLQVRAVSVNQVLVGYYRIPSCGDQPLEVVVNPHGLEARSEKVVWNRGDGRCKLVTLASNKAIQSAQPLSSTAASGSGGSSTSSSSSSSSADSDAACGVHTGA